VDNGAKANDVTAEDNVIDVKPLSMVSYSDANIEMIDA